MRCYNIKQQNIEKIDWKTFFAMINKLAKKVRDSKIKFDLIYGVPRGGLIPAVILSHKLRIRLTVKKEKLDLCDMKILVIDDIANTGKTLEKLCCGKHKTMTLHIKEGTVFRPDFFISKIKDNKQILYPWDID